ncbi:MAG: proline dehydrogenase family protein, partial [Actinobacteria bacterium]|nr:proline dehydrogenase family protein [Actinomycetota bacterium]
ETAALDVAEAIAKAFSTPFSTGHQDVFLSASTGVALGRPGEMTTDELIRHADAAGQLAKSRGAGTIRLFEKTQPVHGNLGIALQAYLHRTPSDLRRLAPLGGHIRLCKGAYIEPEEVALTAKSEVDEAYARQLRDLMGMEQTLPAVATHDLSLVNLAKALAAAREEPFEFQMLYGVRPDLQRRLVDEGYPLRIYLPFGSQWYPYLTRRLAERPANAWFFLKNLFGR